MHASALRLTQLIKSNNPSGNQPNPAHKIPINNLEVWLSREYMFGLSFLTTQNIYKDYFEGRQRLHKLQKCEEKCDQKPCLP